MSERDLENVRVDGLTSRPLPPLAFTVERPGDLRLLRQQWAERDSIPVQVADRTQGIDHSWPGMDVRTLLTGDESSGRQCVHDIIVAPGAGLPPHAHGESDTYWYVMSGEIELTIGSVRERAGPSAFGYAPKETTQAIYNASTGPARLFAVYFPAGADRAFGEAHAHWQASGDTDLASYLAILGKYGFRFDLDGPQKNDARANAAIDRMEFAVETPDDFEKLRDAWRERAPTPKLIHDAGAQKHHTRSGVAADVIVSGDEDSGCAVFLQGDVAPQHVAPFHHQPTEEEMFLVLEGEVQLTCGSKTAVLSPGAFGFAPRYATHGFTNPTQKPARMMTVNSPAGHERGFEMMVRERANPSGRFEELVVAHGWRMHKHLELQKV